MRLNVYVIFDTASGSTRPPFFLQADGEANRLFLDLATNQDSDIGKHPEDYSIYRIGTYDNNAMTLHPEPAEVLMTGAQAVSRSRATDPTPALKLQRLEQEQAEFEAKNNSGA